MIPCMECDEREKMEKKKNDMEANFSLPAFQTCNEPNSY